MQHCDRFQRNSGTKNTRRANEECAQRGDDPICGAQVGRTLAPAIEDQQLVPKQQGLSDNAPESARTCESRRGHNQMNK
jgi:hypothetical protein